MDIDAPAALITGAKRIGAAVGVELASRGYDVGLAWRTSQHEAEDAADDTADDERPGTGRPDRSLLLVGRLSQRPPPARDRRA